MNNTDFTWREVGHRIQALRRSKGLRQVDLAAAASLTHAAISIVEAGLTSPRLATLQQIASALDCSVRLILCGSDNQLRSKHEAEFDRIAAILGSQDPDAVRTFWDGVAASEAMIRRRAMATSYPHRQNVGCALNSYPDAAPIVE
jgi:transcriptional regulator with XRE-family HTH domain